MTISNERNYHTVAIDGVIAQEAKEYAVRNRKRLKQVIEEALNEYLKKLSAVNIGG